MNPELRRHAWQDLRLHELLITPIVLAVITVACIAATDAPAEALAWGAMGLFVALTIGWGTLRAFASVSDEVRDHTWDFQRMTALAPSHIAFGKIFGAPLLQWYIGAWCLLVFALAAPRTGMTHVAGTMIGLVALAVLLHAVGVTGSLLSARTAQGTRARRASGVAFLLLVFNVLPFALLLGGGRNADARMSWWGLELAEHTFAAGSAVAFAGWALLWACRAMARELREPARYGASAAFAVFFGAWVAGHHAWQPARALLDGLAGAAAAFVLATYAGVVSDPLTRVSLARLRRHALRVPGWAIDGAAGVGLGLVALALGSALALSPQRPWQIFTAPALVATVALMAVRDAAFISCFTLSGALRRPVARAIFYLALADFLLPAAFMVTHNPTLAGLVMPLFAFGSSARQPVAIMALHAIVATGVLLVRVRRRAPAP